MQNNLDVSNGNNELPNLGVYLDNLNPFVFQQLKKDCDKGLEVVNKHWDKRSGDLLEMFHQDMPKEVFFQEPTESKKGLEREILQICHKMCMKWPELMDKLSFYSKMFDDGTPDFQLFVERFWINYQRPGEYIPLHQHSGIFSFVVWVQIPYYATETLEANKNEAFSLNKGYQGQFEFVYTDMLGQVKTLRLADGPGWQGKICVFPAGLYHQVYPFYNDEIRITVSGNIRAKYE
tara:strand:- start:6393 stop:7094 length:702 start_codon:yes stop_codon:yes gene_type:complete